MLRRHDAVDRLRILEREERKASRAVRFGIAHDGAVGDLAKLLKVGLERVCGATERSVLRRAWFERIGRTVGCVPVQSSDEHLSAIENTARGERRDNEKRGEMGRKGEMD